MPISAEACKQLLEQSYARAEQAFFRNQPPADVGGIRSACDTVFASKTQAYREALLGCLLARLNDRSRDISRPYIDQGENAFSGRSLDETVVNPFLGEKRIPCSRGPYLSVFRRQVRFDETTRQGLKDKTGYDAFLEVLARVARERDAAKLLAMLDSVVFRFILLREQSDIGLTKLDRISLPQYKRLIRGLLARPSGGVFPVFVVLAMIETIIGRFGLRCAVEFHGINVADKPSGRGGDITISEQGKPVVTVEVTERSVDAARVRSTFTEKIAPAGLSEYVFGVHAKKVDAEASALLDRYFAQGYDVNFVDIEEWVFQSLATVGVRGRQLFQERLRHHISGGNVPKTLKVYWNEEIGKLVA